MILMYHKVCPDSPTMWWVEVDSFYRQLCEIKCRNVVYLDDYDPADPNQVVITFDGVYKNVLKFAAPLLKSFGYPFELFVTSDYIGRDNAFDTPEPPADFASIEDLQELVQCGGRLQWHTRSHINLKDVTDPVVIAAELTVPPELEILDSTGLRWFGYPHGEFNAAVLAQTKLRFVGGVSCHQGNDSDRYLLNRVTVVNETAFKKATITVIIASYNYGSFLIEAIESVLRQTRSADEILVADDCSTDNTMEIAQDYAKRYPRAIRYMRNEHNMGIVGNFNKAVSLATSDYICFLGADNRFRSDYLEKTAEILDYDQAVGIAYTDFALFGPRAKLEYVTFPKERRGPVKENYYYVINFPEFNKEGQQLLETGNFIHGSSLYRKKTFLEAGGYQERTETPEDYNMFLRMVKKGWQAKRVPHPVLEYRQHSKDQTNIRLVSYAELNYYKVKFIELMNALDIDRRQLDLDRRQLEQYVLQLSEKNQKVDEVNKIVADLDQRIKDLLITEAALYQSLSWRLTKPVRRLYEMLQRSPVAGILRITRSTAQRIVDLKRASDGKRFMASILRNHLVGKALAARNANFDVIVFPVIDWHFRTQRPQQLAKQLAAAGHRVFYLTTNFTNDHQRPAFQITESPEPNVFLVTLQCPIPHPQVYRDTLSGNQLLFTIESLLLLHRICEIRQSVSLVNLPFWRPLAKALPGNLQVYDCMDHHGGFSTNTNLMLQEEKKLLHEADLVITSSQRLSEMVGEDVPNTVIRNGAEVAFFAQRPEKLAFNPQRPVVGYYGAISEWFDIDLVIAAARAYPAWDFVLVGSTFGCNVTEAEKVANIRFLGEVLYSTLPGYLYAFDVCIIPFIITELTLCTNPVKVYEYLSAGKPVVATSMPELRLIEHQIHVADSDEEFVAKLGVAMHESADMGLADQRKVWARQHDWQMRAAELDSSILACYPKASVVVLTYNNIHLTKDCLDSLNRFTAYPEWELIVVDNASTDGTQAYLKEFEAQHDHVKVILNATNLGFAAGNNIGVKEATGEYLVLLNNDTVVTQGWLFDLIRHLRKDDSLGLLGPVTNSIGNEAQIEISYTGVDDMHIKARNYTSMHSRKLMPAKTIAFFCVALRRTVWEQVGTLDEAYSVGYFEDDDYCRRIGAKGFTAAIAEDVFIQHQHSASFSILSPEQRNEIFERNKQVYETKWGTWAPHEYR